MDVGGTPIPMLTLDNILLSSALPSTSSWLPSLATEQFGHDQSQVPLDIDWISLLSGCEENPSSSSATARDGDKNNEGGNSTKKVAKAKKSTPRRIAFQTRSADDILDDGYRWRKYGQKAVKNSSHPRSYYRCVHHTCNVKKQIQRLSKDPGIVVTTYEGMHNHPCEKLMETLAPLLKQLQFLSRI